MSPPRTNAAVTVAQIDPKLGEATGNRARTVEIIRENRDSDLIVMPELVTSGYSFNSHAEVEEVAEPVDGPTAQAWKDVAAETGTWVIGGFPERDGGSLYNSALVASPRGIEGVYRKIHLWNEENRWFNSGSEVPTFETPFGRLGIQICNDIWFPELTITQAQDGAEIIVLPTNWVPEESGRPSCWTTGVHQAIAHANANRVFIACADRVGTERNVTFEGQSVVVSPDGVPLVGPLPDSGSHTATATCDISQAHQKLLTEYNHAMEDRRPDIYDI
jgi:predicted amidohydrolase